MNQLPLPKINSTGNRIDRETRHLKGEIVLQSHSCDDQLMSTLEQRAKELAILLNKKAKTAKVCPTQPSLLIVKTDRDIVRRRPRRRQGGSGYFSNPREH